MSIVQDNSRYPIFTLRKHTDAITAIDFVRIPIATQTRLITSQPKPPTEELYNSTTTTTTCKPYVLTADEKGNLKLWDLKTHRVVKEVNHAHNGSILTIKQLGFCNDGIIDPALFGCFLTHSRDHTIKFWRLFNDEGLVEELKELYEMPVNALNFSNIDIYGHYLISSNTSNSNSFDIYDLKFLYQEGAKHLERIFEAVDLHKTALEQSFKFDEFNIRSDVDDDVNDDVDQNVNRVDKFGIIMKFLWIRRDLISIGYESGHVVVFELNLQDRSLKILQISNHHFPNPVLAISFNGSQNIILSSSIRSKIITHDLTNLSNDPKLIKIDLNKISNIITYEDKLILSSWNGFIKFFQLHPSSKEYTELAQFKKPKGLQVADLNVVGRNQSNDIQVKKQHIVKPNSLAVFIKDKNGLDREYQKRLDRRDLMLLKKSFLCVGYDDGTVMIYDDL